MQLMPMYWMRALGGALYIVGMLLFGYNILMTWRRRPAAYEEPVIQARAARRARTSPSRSTRAPVPAGALGAIRRDGLAPHVGAAAGRCSPC